MRPPSVVLSYGLGTDSTAILLRWLLEPESRDFDLADLVVVTAMTGDEWDITKRQVEEHVLPLLRRHGVRYVQVARGERYVLKDGTGAVVLADTRSPDAVHIKGRYRLSDELRSNGTVAQLSGARRCSATSKGAVLDWVIGELTRGQPYRHVVGFEAGEPGRAIRDTAATAPTRGGRPNPRHDPQRTAQYPLIEWGWDRAACEAYIASVTGGVLWRKSACALCVFGLANKEGRARTLEDLDREPEAAVAALLVEHTAMALNPSQTLMGPAGSAYEWIRRAGRTAVIDAFTAELVGQEHALYEVRRILKAKADDPERRGQSPRSVRRVAEGDRDTMLADLASRGPVTVGEDGIARVWLRRRGRGFPTAEHLFVVAPATVEDKELPGFARWWAALPADGPGVEPPRQEALFVA